MSESIKTLYIIIGIAGNNTPTNRKAANSIGLTSTNPLTMTLHKEKNRDESVASTSPRYGHDPHIGVIIFF